MPIVCRVEAGPHARNYEIYLTNAVSVEGLVKEFGLIRAVDELNLSIPKGQIVALLGGNGAGKTTTLSMLLGVLLPTRGHVEVLGTDLTSSPSSRTGIPDSSRTAYADLRHKTGILSTG